MSTLTPCCQWGVRPARVVGAGVARPRLPSLALLRPWLGGSLSHSELLCPLHPQSQKPSSAEPGAGGSRRSHKALTWGPQCQAPPVPDAQHTCASGPRWTLTHGRHGTARPCSGTRGLRAASVALSEPRLLPDGSQSRVPSRQRRRKALNPGVLGRAVLGLRTSVSC